MKLSIVIVNYNSSADLARCLASLRRHPPSCEHVVVVVDNASRESGLAAVRQAYPDVRWLMNAENAGYSRGANLGIAAVPADYALILNPDIEVLPGALDALLALADARPRAGIIAPQLLGDDGQVQHSALRFYTIRTLLLRRTPLGKLFPNSRSVRAFLMLDFDHNSERAVDWVLGGAMLVRRQARERTGPLDERFFLYFEDVDWCYRMWQAGWEVLYTPAARFIHGHRRASARGAFNRAFWFHMGSFISFYEKWGLIVYLLKKWRLPLTVALRWLLDMVALNGALLVAYLLRAALNPLFHERLFALSEYGPLFGFASLLATATFVLRGRYDRARAWHATQPSTAAALAGLVSLLLLAATFLSHQRLYSRPVLLIFVPVFWLALSAVGVLYAVLRSRLERDHLSLERTILVGCPPALATWLEAHGDLRRDGVDPVGYVCDAPPGGPDPGSLCGGEVPWLGRRADLLPIVLRHRVSQVVFWDWSPRDSAGAGELRALHHEHIRLRWHLADDGLLTTVRPEAFGGASTLVLEPHAGLGAGQLAGAFADRLAGVMLLAVSGLPYLLAHPGTRAGGLATYAWRPNGAARSPRLRLVAGPDGHPRRLWWQAPLGLDLVLGRVTVFTSEAAPGPMTSIWSDLAFAPEEFTPVAAEDGPPARP